jgi:hypothetical protein
MRVAVPVVAELEVVDVEDGKGEGFAAATRERRGGSPPLTSDTLV